MDEILKEHLSLVRAFVTNPCYARLIFSLQRDIDELKDSIYAHTLETAEEVHKELKLKGEVKYAERLARSLLVLKQKALKLGEYATDESESESDDVEPEPEEPS